MEAAHRVQVGGESAGVSGFQLFDKGLDMGRDYFFRGLWLLIWLGLVMAVLFMVVRSFAVAVAVAVPVALPLVSQRHAYMPQ